MTTRETCNACAYYVHDERVCAVLERETQPDEPICGESYPWGEEADE